PLDHLKCEYHTKSCNQVDDCLRLGKRNLIYQQTDVKCALSDPLSSNGICDAGTLIKEKDALQLFINSEQNKEKEGDKKAIVEGSICQVDDDCVNLAHRIEPDALTNCYACIKTITPTVSNTSKVCVKTSTGCSSGICLNGQCLGKVCESHMD